VTRANAEAEAITLVSTAAETYFKERAEVMRRLEVLNHTLSENTKFVLPSNGEFVNVLGLGDAGSGRRSDGGGRGPAPGGGSGGGGTGGSGGPSGPSGGMGGGFGGGEIPVIPLRRS